MSSHDAGFTHCAFTGEERRTVRAGHVDIWAFDIGSLSDHGQHLAASLDKEESRRAQRLYQARDRDRFVAARGRLRHLLGTYVGLAPGSIRFEYGARGKPVLAPDQGPDIHFSLAHAGDLCLIAVAGEPVGVDVEEVRPIEDALAIAKLAFSPAEVAVLADLAPDERSRAFLRGWTRKEAVVKATGEGLQAPLDSFAVSMLSGQSARIISGQAYAAWSLYHLEPGTRYVGALAVAGHGHTLSRYLVDSI